MTSLLRIAFLAVSLLPTFTHAANLPVFAGGKTILCAIDPYGLHCHGEDKNPVKAPIFNSPMEVYASETVHCVRDLDGLHCWTWEQPDTVHDFPSFAKVRHIEVYDHGVCGGDQNKGRCITHPWLPDGLKATVRDLEPETAYGEGFKCHIAKNASGSQLVCNGDYFTTPTKSLVIEQAPTIAGLTVRGKTICFLKSKLPSGFDAICHNIETIVHITTRAGKLPFASKRFLAPSSLKAESGEALVITYDGSAVCEKPNQGAPRCMDLSDKSKERCFQREPTEIFCRREMKILDTKQVVSALVPYLDDQVCFFEHNLQCFNHTGTAKNTITLKKEDEFNFDWRRESLPASLKKLSIYLHRPTAKFMTGVANLLTETPIKEDERTLAWDFALNVVRFYLEDIELDLVNQTILPQIRYTFAPHQYWSGRRKLGALPRNDLTIRLSILVLFEAFKSHEKVTFLPERKHELGDLLLALSSINFDRPTKDMREEVLSVLRRNEAFLEYLSSYSRTLHMSKVVLLLKKFLDET